MNNTDKIILGLLMLQSRTIYTLRERIGKGLNLMYSSSTGSIQAALKKLLAGGYIKSHQKTEGGRKKRYYCITDLGRERFLEWVNSPMDGENFKNPELAKLYFMGMSDKAARIRNIRDYIQKLEQKHEELRRICEFGESYEPPSGGEEIAKFQLLSARYGRDMIKFNIDWFQKLCDEMEEEND